jgi:hypothetical protein
VILPAIRKRGRVISTLKLYVRNFYLENLSRNSTRSVASG